MQVWIFLKGNDMKGLIIYLFVVIMIVALYGFAYSMDSSNTKDSNKQSTKIIKVSNKVPVSQMENF